MRIPPGAAGVDDQGYYLTSAGTRSNFRVPETVCRCGCGHLYVSQTVLDLAQEIRAEYGVLHVLSGVRCTSHNRSVGGARRSRHLPDENGVGHALDLTPRRSDLFVDAMAEDFRRRHPHAFGVGVYRTFLHIDDRPRAVTWEG